MMKRSVLRLAIAASLLPLIVASTVFAQGTRADYERADALQERTRGTVFGGVVRPRWLPGGDRFWYRSEGAGQSWRFVLVDASRGEQGPAFDHERLAERYEAATGQPQSPDRLPIDHLIVEDDGILRFDAEDRAWRFDPETGDLSEGDRVEIEPEQRRDRDRDGHGRRHSPRGEKSPDGRWSVTIRDQNILLREFESGEESPLSFEGSEIDGYEEGVFWSPDSSKFVALRRLEGDHRTVHLIESSPEDQVQPKLHSHDYLKPGDRPTIGYPHLFDVLDRREIPIDGGLVPNPWNIDQFRWRSDSKAFTFVYNQRGHQIVRIVAVEADSGKARAIVEEQSKTFIDYSQKMFVHHLDDTRELIWASERDGWNHLYLFDNVDGSFKRQLTTGSWVVRGVDRVDEEAREVWFRAVGIHPEQDPYQVHHARVSLDGGDPVILTDGDGTHTVDRSPDGRYLIDTYSRVDLPPVVELRDGSNGALILELERADWSALLDTGWRVPERFVAKGRDGETDIYGVIFRPSCFDPEGSYPVIEQIYAGPQGAFVPKAFAPFHGPQALAELGFIVVQIDGMGTNWRSKAFHDVCWRDLADAGFPDRIAWLRAAAEADPALDLDRVGIYGGSAGGQNALGGLLFHPGFYKVGVADCGCHDNRMDKIWWNEQWMGWPVGPHYAASSNVEHAGRLRGKLLLTVGELDRNVDPASTMQVVDALIRSGKDFDLVVFPGAGHGAGGSPYGERRRRDFFVEHLLGVEPPDWNREGTETEGAD